jgi:hypothetical protein
MPSWGHIEAALGGLWLVLMIYWPPKTWGGLGKFIERHFADSVGFYILHLGIALVVLGGIWPQVAGISSTGNSLILAGMTVLKLTPNGAAPTSFKVDQVPNQSDKTGG